MFATSSSSTFVAFSRSSSSSSPRFASTWCIFLAFVGLLFSLHPTVGTAQGTATIDDTTSTSTDDDAFACIYTSKDEDEALTCIGDISLALITKDDSSRAIEYVMNKGWWTASNRIVETSATVSVDISTIVHQTASRIRTKLQLLSDALGKIDNAAGIPPAFEWAQSPDSIFLNIKFAHKLDTPATLGCEPMTPIYGSRSVLFKAECKEKRKTFTLNLSLYKEISPDNSTWSIASVGRTSITLRKSTNATWPRLLSSKNKPGNMHVWWTMKEKYEKELEEWEKKARSTKPADENNNTTATSSTPSPATTDEILSTPTPNPSTSTEPVPLPSVSNTTEDDLLDDINGTLPGENITDMTSSYFVEKSLKRIARTRQKELDINTEAVNHELQRLEMDGKTRRKAVDDKARQDKIDIDEKAKLQKQEIDVDIENKRKEIYSRRNVERSSILQRYQDAEEHIRSGSGTPEYLIGTIGGGLHPIPSLLTPEEQMALNKEKATKEMEERTRLLEQQRLEREQQGNLLELGDGKENTNTEL